MICVDIDEIKLFSANVFNEFKLLYGILYFQINVILKLLKLLMNNCF